MVPAGRQLIQSYGDGRFRIAGQVHQGSVLVFPERTLPWPVTGVDGITLDSLAEVTASGQAADILIIGCGPAFLPVPKGFREGLKAAAVALEWMDTGAASRTFNVLLAEDRACAAALIAVD